MDIDAFEAGEGLDAHIANIVFGLEVVVPKTKGYPVKVRAKGEKRRWADCDPLPRYSADIAAAWKVVEAFVLSGVSIGYDTQCGDWLAALGRDMKCYTTGDTAPLAICKAALKVCLKADAHA